MVRTALKWSQKLDAPQPEREDRRECRGGEGGAGEA